VIFSPLASATIAILVLLFGYWLRDRSALARRLNFPPPVLGGLVVALIGMICRMSGLPGVTFSLPLQSPLMIGFFTSLGFGASFRLLKSGGRQVVLLLLVASAVAILQGLVGAGIASIFGMKPLLGVLVGTVTLSGGPATGLAFAPQFELAGVAHSAEIATATAMAGIVLASMAGSPLATWIIARYSLEATAARAAEPVEAARVDEKKDVFFVTLRTLGFLLVAMWIGDFASWRIQNLGVILPGYIGAMLVAVVLRNIDDGTGWLQLPLREISHAGTLALALFLVMALMSLDLTVLLSLALPLIVNLVVQLLVIAALVLGPVWYVMGRDYDAAVTSGGFVGFMLGTSANAMAIMFSLVERYGPAPRSFLAVPLVGTFLLDFTNALIITGFINILR
jgi:ESS family glutamate:Na+ symporter